MKKGEEIKNWVEESIEKGYSKQEIIDLLSESGYTADEIEDILKVRTTLQNIPKIVRVRLSISPGARVSK